MMKMIKGVNPYGVKPELLLAIMVAEGIWAKETPRGLELTSLCDGGHSYTSLHYDGKAVDFRTWEDDEGTQWSWEKKERVAEELRGALGNNPDYDVVVEETHIHLEHQPKRRTANGS